MFPENHYRYKIILFKNKKRVKYITGAQKAKTIWRRWADIKGTKKPRFTVEYMGRDETKRNEKVKYELVLLFPCNKRVKSVTYVKDEIGRIKEAVVNSEKFRIKEIFPFWKEETIFDHQIKNHIRYHELLEKVLKHRDIGQVFKLNTKIIVQVDDNFEIYETKNLNDAMRLFEIVREDVIKEHRGNFIFVKDIATSQRKLLYKLLEEKGYKKNWLTRHYSY